ncbi:zf-HC2 domain-containing protein [Streptomyces sp. NPDC056244]|uniref:zf-HC2 domain-containing protein n=1 Tax=Streptomyces sp. NPDC056244 TaxID=3345762 RepID=UPI0035DD61A3
MTGVAGGAADGGGTGDSGEGAADSGRCPGPSRPEPGPGPRGPVGPEPRGPHVRALLGAYVLGALAPAEDRRVADHLAGCDPCGAAYLEVADTPSLLALCDEDDLL